MTAPAIVLSRTDKEAATPAGAGRRWRTLADRWPNMLALVLGSVAALGFAPLQLWPLTVVAFALWLSLVHDAPTMRAVLWRGWLFGLGHFTVNNNWIGHAFDFQDAMPHALGYLAPVLLALYLAVYPMLAAALAWRFASPRSVGDRATRPGWGYALVFGAAWIATEYLRATMFTGYAWDPLGVVWVPVEAVAHLAALVGTYALSGLTVAAAGALLLVPRRWSSLVLPTLLLLALLTEQRLGYRGSPPPVAATAPRLRIVQPDVGQDQRGQTDGELMFRRLAALSGRPGSAPRLLLWPEGVVREYLEDGYPEWAYGGFDPWLARYRLARLLGPRDRLLTGATALQFNTDGNLLSATNSVFQLTPSGRLAGRYDKAHLVPYGEYLPMRSVLGAIGLSRLVPGDIDFADGPGPRGIDVAGFGRIGVQLCYEIIFSGEVVDRSHRPRLLFNPSNDAWFGAWGPPQHLAQARMRAIEEGLPVVRATPTGISAVIDASGRVLAHQPLGTSGALEVPMPAALPPTLFARVGNVMAGLIAVALLGVAVAVRRRAR